MSEGPGTRPILKAAGAWAGILVFALFVNRPSPYFLLAIAGLLVTTLAMANSASSGGSFWVLFGITRHKTGSVIPAVSGHVLFDILVYGDWAQAPWWVWGASIP